MEGNSVNWSGPNNEPWQRPEDWEDWPIDSAGPAYWLALRWGLPHEYYTEEL